MTELEEHIALMGERKAALLSEIGRLPDGERKASLRLMLEGIDEQIQRITAPKASVPGKAKVPFTPGRDLKANR